MFVGRSYEKKPRCGRGGGAHQHGRDAWRLRGGRRSRCSCVVDPHHDRRGERRSSFPSFPLTFPTICPNVNRQPSLWAKPQHTDSGGGAIPMFPRRLPRVLRPQITATLPRPAPLVRMQSSHVAVSDVRSCVPGAPLWLFREFSPRQAPPQSSAESELFGFRAIARPGRRGRPAAHDAPCLPADCASARTEVEPPPKKPFVRKSRKTSMCSMYS
jgi:hypothetical protein